MYNDFYLFAVGGASVKRFLWSGSLVLTGSCLLSKCFQQPKEDVRHWKQEVNNHGIVIAKLYFTYSCEYFLLVPMVLYKVNVNSHNILSNSVKK